MPPSVSWGPVGTPYRLWCYNSEDFQAREDFQVREDIQARIVSPCSTCIGSLPFPRDRARMRRYHQRWLGRIDPLWCRVIVRRWNTRGMGVRSGDGGMIWLWMMRVLWAREYWSGIAFGEFSAHPFNQPTNHTHCHEARARFSVTTLCFGNNA